RNKMENSFFNNSILLKTNIIKYRNSVTKAEIRFKIYGILVL
ncbi:hypothetical protein LEP1GSC116_0470, partial [Leptospira interrogans serovar Icterohaemorrhagiae str. Verdun HP]